MAEEFLDTAVCGNCVHYENEYCLIKPRFDKKGRGRIENVDVNRYL